MPRKKVLGAATPRQVLEFFDQADLGAVEVVYDLVGGVMQQRRAENAPVVATPGRKARAPKAGKATTGVSEPAGD